MFSPLLSFKRITSQAIPVQRSHPLTLLHIPQKKLYLAKHSTKTLIALIASHFHTTPPQKKRASLHPRQLIHHQKTFQTAPHKQEKRLTKFFLRHGQHQTKTPLKKKTPCLNHSQVFTKLRLTPACIIGFTFGLILTLVRPPHLSFPISRPEKVFHCTNKQAVLHTFTQRPVREKFY